MSIEAIREIQDVEKSMDGSRGEARAKAQKIIADAEGQGRELLQRRQEAAAAREAEEMRDAGEQAQKRREEILAAAGEECRRLEAAAAEHMAAAVKSIVERGVES